MTITTSKQLAEVLGPKWKPVPWALFLRAALGRAVVTPSKSGGFVAILQTVSLRRKDPRAAVLALADRLEAEAQALRESVKEGP